LDKKYSDLQRLKLKLFLNCENLQEKVGCKSPVEALGEIRKKKDNWRG